MTFSCKLHCIIGVSMILVASSALAAPAYITVGDDAISILRVIAPDTKLLLTRDLKVNRPKETGSSDLVSVKERVYAVEVDEMVLPQLSRRMHEDKHRCGGFKRHTSKEDAMNRLENAGKAHKSTTKVRYRIDDYRQVSGLLPKIRHGHILSTIKALSAFQNRDSSTKVGAAASDWLAARWRKLAQGRRDVEVTQVAHAGWPQKSVKLVIRGRGHHATETVVMGAHLDTIVMYPTSTGGNNSGIVPSDGPGSNPPAPGNGSGGIPAAGDPGIPEDGFDPETERAPGADDDASGIASLTEVIRVLLDSGWRPKRTLEIFAYSAEEIGLMGSHEIAVQYTKDKRNVVGVLQLDMTAYQGDITDLWLITDHTNAAQNRFLAALAANYLPELTVGYDVCGYGCSDHASWDEQGFPASYPFESSFLNHNHTIHTAEDVTSVFNNQAIHALKFSKLALTYAVELGDD